MARVTTSTLQKMLQEHDPITMLTCTDASFAELLDGAGIDVFLIGDSLGMVVQGHDSTLPVTMDDMVYHTQCVARKTNRALVLGDLPKQLSPLFLEGCLGFVDVAGQQILQVALFADEPCGSLHGQLEVRIAFGRDPRPEPARLDRAEELPDCGTHLLELAVRR